MNFFRPCKWLLPFLLLLSQKLISNKPAYDSVNIEKYLERAYKVMRSEPDSALFLSRQAYIQSNRSGYKTGLLKSLLSLGMSYHNKNNNKKAIYFLNEALAAAKRFVNRASEAKAHLLLGQVNDWRARYSVALEECFEALTIYDNIGNKNGINQVNMLLSHIYYNQQDYNKAKEYILRIDHESLENFPETEKHVYYINLGSIYSDLAQTDSAIYCFTKTLNIQKKLNNEIGLADVYTNLGNVFHVKQEFDSSLFYYFKALKIYQKEDIKYFLGVNYSNIGEIYLRQAKFANAESYLTKGLNLALQTEDQEGIKIGYLNLSELYSKKNQFEKAYYYNQKYINLGDSLMTREHQNQINEIISRHVTYKKDKEIEILNSHGLISKHIIETEKSKTFILTWSLLVLIILIVYTITSLKINKKNNSIISQQKNQVEKQKGIIEQKNKDITDSINYASRLQKAIVPPTKLILEYLPQAFVIFKPKDIVAGDFYWMENVKLTDNGTNGNTKLVLIASADCTGHGVPGAMLSLICSNALNRAVKEFNLYEPGKILNKVRELVIETFQKSETEVKDGMDISLCSISLSDRKIKWSGANNPLWIIPKDHVNNWPVLKEIKPNKQPIGIVDTPVPFTTHSLQLNEGDMIYLFTDGFADQFGGPYGKKYKYTRFKELILSLHNLPMIEQKHILERDFLDWKSFNEQVDDVCVIGIRL